MALLGKIMSVFTDKVIVPKAENLAAQVFDTCVVDRQLEKKVISLFLQEYENEPFYMDLDSYITNYNVIANLISASRGKTSLQPNSKTAFISENIKLFIRRCPEYNKNTVQLSQVRDVFDWIFDFVFMEVNQLSPHSDIGKLQNDIRRGEAESEFRDNRNYAVTHDISQKLDFICSQIPALQGITDTAKQELGYCSSETEKFTDEIKEIEYEYQSRNLFEDALLRYFELLQSITTKLRGQPQAQIDTLICTLYCNIALCQSNLCDIEKAFRSLEVIPAPAAAESKIYHLVYAAIVVQHVDSEKYTIAKQHLDKALEGDPFYHRAFLLRQYLYALMEHVDCQSNIKELNNHFSSILIENSDRELIADYYMNCGLIFQAYDDPYSAAKNFEVAVEYGYDEVIAKYNLLTALYGQAVKGLSKDERVLFPQVDYSKMNYVIAELKSIILDNQINMQPYLTIKEKAVSLYVSACTLIGIRHNLSPLKVYLELSRDYEIIRELILGSDEELTENIISLLDKEDQQFLHFRTLLDSDDLTRCKDEIIELIDNSSENISAPLFHVLLQVCLISKEPGEYWKYKEMAVSAGVNGAPISAMDACAYELEGNIEQAKCLFDNVAATSNQYHVLENALRFYKRNSFFVECESLYLRIQNLQENASISIDDIDTFYSEAISFFLSQQSALAEEFLNRINSRIISLDNYYNLQALLYSNINDTARLNDSLTHINSSSNCFQDGFNKALCQRWLLNYEEALETCFVLLEITSDENEQVKLYWLISDLYLLKENLDESYVWAQKSHDLKIQNPYDRSHQALITRALRCGHTESFSSVLDYKQKHPVVVDWIEAFTISDADENPLASITKQLEDRFPNAKDYAERERDIAEQYKKGVLSINLLLQYYNGEWWQLFQFAAKNKLKISMGNRERLQLEQALIKEHLVVDAQTLIFMSYYGCLSALQSITCLHINFGSVATLQYCYLSWDHPCIKDLMRWIESTDNIVFEADGFINDENVLTKTLSRDFVAGCNIAQKNKVPFLYLDAVASTYQAVPEIGIPENLSFISIPALCEFFGQTQPRLKDQMLYRLLTGGNFIGFSADTIIEQVQSHNFEVSYDLIQPFLICKSDYDMRSFSDVYLQAINRLQKLHPESAAFLAEIILNDTARVWRRGTYYRVTANNYADNDARNRSRAIAFYVARIVAGIKQILPCMSNELSSLCSELQRLVLESMKPDPLDQIFSN